jgi:GT2 family glycosyltransferase
MYNIMNIFTDPEEEFYPNGCSLIFRKSEISKPFDPDYFYYSEDLYLGLKARFAGMRIKFVKNSLVHHFGSGSGSASEKKTYYSERNRLLNLYLFFSFWTVARLLPYIIFNHTAKLFISIFSSKFSFKGLIKAYLWFYINIPLILKKRKELKNEFRTGESEIIAKMSSKIINEDTNGPSFINKLSYFYSRLVGFKPVEFFSRKT